MVHDLLVADMEWVMIGLVRKSGKPLAAARTFPLGGHNNYN